MWAMVINVDIEPGVLSSEGREGLERDVVPMAKQMPGFQQGIWMRHENGTSGMGTVVFEDEQQARDAAAIVSPGTKAPGGATIRDCAVFEVLARA